MDNDRFNSTFEAAEEHKKEVIDQLTRLIDGIKKMIESIEKTGYDNIAVSYIEAAAKQNVNFLPSISEIVTTKYLETFLNRLEQDLANLQESYSPENAFELGENVTSSESFANEVLSLLKDYRNVNQRKFNEALENKKSLEKVLEEIYERIRSIRQESLLILDTADMVFQKPSYRRKQILRGHSKELKSEIADNARTRDMLESQVTTLYLESFSIKRAVENASFSPKNYDSRVFSVIDLPSINPKYADYR